MADSVALLQSIIDVDKSLTSRLDELVNPRMYDSNEGLKNIAKLSTSQIVAKLREDNEMWQMLTEVLKNEFQLYNFAVAVHKLQVEALREKHGDTYKFTTLLTN